MHTERPWRAQGAGRGRGKPVPRVAQPGAFARCSSAACVGAPAAAALRDPGIQPGTRLKAPTCRWQPVSRGGFRPPGPMGKGFVGFSRTVQRRLRLCGRVLRGWGCRWALRPRRSLGGAMLGVWAGLGYPGPGRAVRPQPRATKEEEGRLAPGARRRGMRRAGSLVQMTREVQRCPHPLGTPGGPRSRRRAGPACLAGEATGSAESTPAHTLPESMLSAALGTSCRVASGLGPLPARCSQSWGRRGARVGGAAPACRPLVFLFPALPLPGPRRFSLALLLRQGTEAWMSSPAP